MPATASPRYRIRRAIPADLDALLALELASFSGDRLSRRRLRHWISADNGILLVAETVPRPAVGSVVAYLLGITRAGSEKLRLYSLATAVAARGQGLGTRLLQRAEREGLARGCRALQLEVAQGNHGAIALYNKLGYHCSGSIAGYYEDGQDAWQMRKLLS
jgi:ribosomal protein S18 acetylase RimI-like enzyme